MEDSIIKKVRIKKIISQTEVAKSFILEPLGWKAEWASGQFITLVFYTPHGEKRRSFSISSSPELGEPLTITIKRLENGEFSRWMIHDATEGEILFTSGISGFFVLPQKKENITLIYFAAGSGINPCFPAIKTALKTTSNEIFLFYSNKSIEQTIFYQEILFLEKQYPSRFRLRWFFSNNNEISKKRLSHSILEEILLNLIKVEKKFRLYICGPYLYTSTINITARAFGILPENIVREDFYPLPRLIIPKPPDINEHTVTILIKGKEFTIKVQYPNSITKAARKQHIELPYSCETGRCGSCVATCISGKIWMAYNEVLMDEEIEKGRVLTCVGFPYGGDAVIKY